MKKLLVCVVILILKFVAGQTGDGKNNSEPNKTAVTFNNCNSKMPNLDPKIEELTLNCVPNISYAQLLTDLGILSLKTLNLHIAPTKSNVTLNPTLFERLNVKKLVIDYKYENKSGAVDYITMSSEVLYVLNEVEELVINGVTVVENKTERDKYEMGPKCANLRILRVSASDLRRVPSGWLEPCKKLVHLQLSQLRQRNGTKEVRRKILQNAKSLRKLEILNCFIEELEDELEGLDNLETLNVAHNQIHYALTTIVLPNLVELDLSYNHIFSSALLSTGMEKQPKLRILSLDYNTVLDICDNLAYRSTNYEPREVAVATWHSPLSRRPLTLNSIQRLSLRGTITTETCFAHLNMDALEYFDLSDSKISAINFRALPMSKARRLEVNVTGCPIRDVPGRSFDEQDYNQLHYEELRITGLNVTLQCDCDEYLWLSKASRERKLVLSGALCASGQDLTTIPNELLQCSKYLCGACTCRRYWQDNATDVECGGELHAIPREPGLRRLFAAGNLVENVTADLPDSLIYLDLSKNHIARVSAQASAALFNQSARRVRFYGNPIICDCENMPFILALMDHFDRVEDYGNLSCIDDGRLVRDVNPYELCFGTSRRLHTVLTATLVAGLGVVALLVGLYYRFGKAIKVYLYSKGLCLFCIREEEIDADREYDAFVSFSHKDEHFVTCDLLPGLEAEPYNYRLCVHYRNWIAGDLIPVQINQSIENSKRTIIVLSKSFLDSFWGILEFRTAHLSALKEGRTRLIIIIVDDILETGNLDGELRSYLRTNTYVKWGDPWFWDKVRYALPHRTIETVSIKVDPHEVSGRTNEEYITDSEIIEDRDVKTVARVNQRDKKIDTDVKRIQKEEKVEESQQDSRIAQGGLKTQLEDGHKQITEVKKSDHQHDAMEKAKYLNVVAPVARQVSTDSAIEMENYT